MACGRIEPIGRSPIAQASVGRAYSASAAAAAAAAIDTTATAVAATTTSVAASFSVGLFLSCHLCSDAYR